MSRGTRNAGANEQAAKAAIRGTTRAVPGHAAALAPTMMRPRCTAAAVRTTARPSAELPLTPARVTSPRADDVKVALKKDTSERAARVSSLVGTRTGKEGGA